MTESVGVIGPAGLLRGRAGPNRISHSAFRQSHRGVALGWRWGRSRVEHRAKILCLRWEEQCHCACDHSYHTREPTNGRPGRSMLVGVRLTPRAYVSPAAIQAPARRSVSNSIASGGRAGVISRSQRFVPKPRRMELAWSLQPRDDCSNRMYARARILGHAFIPWVMAPPACLFRRGLCGCPDAGGGPGWIRSGVLYSGPNRSE